jgi:hypothetical protein
MDKNSKYILCADKLTNINSIHNDLICIGAEKTWSKFYASKDETGWHFKSCIEEFEKDSNLRESFMFKKLKFLFEKVFN